MLLLFCVIDALERALVLGRSKEANPFAPNFRLLAKAYLFYQYFVPIGTFSYPYIFYLANCMLTHTKRCRAIIILIYIHLYMD